MTRLADQQQALIQALFEWPPHALAGGNSSHGEPRVDPENIANYLYLTGTRGLKSYQTNGKVLAYRALTAAYPVLAQLVGAESFEHLAHALWHAHPPVRGDLAQWGDALPAFVAASDQLADVPYLGDVARVEWALHQCASRADRAAQPDTYALLTSADPAHLRLLLSPGCAVVQSAWPVASIVTAHQATTAPVASSTMPNAPTSLNLAQVNDKLQRGQGESAVVWRYHYQPRVREARPGEADFLLALLAGHSLAEVLPDDSPLDFGAWLTLAVSSGLLLAVETAPAGNLG